MGKREKRKLLVELDTEGMRSWWDLKSPMPWEMKKKKKKKKTKKEGLSCQNDMAPLSLKQPMTRQRREVRAGT
jgi:hypothetical protein